MLVQPGQFLAHDLVRAAKRVVAGARQYDVMRVSAAKRLEQRNLRRLNGERGIEFPPISSGSVSCGVQSAKLGRDRVQTRQPPSVGCLALWVRRSPTMRSSNFPVTHCVRSAPTIPKPDTARPAGQGAWT
jgi:hypothetical protein